MFYYEVQKNYDEERIGIYSSEEKVEKNSIVIIPQGMRLEIGKVIKELDAYTAMSQSDCRIEPLVCVLDLTEFNRRNEEKIKAFQIEQIMEEKMDIIKRLEAYRKVAEKNSEFKELFLEYERMKEGKAQ